MEKLVLGIVQGITEFLPVSSSGHLVLLRHLFGIEGKGAFYEVFLHSATFLSVVVVLRGKIFNRRHFYRYFKLSLIATLPLFLVVPFADSVEATFENPRLLPLTFLLTSLFLFSTYFVRHKGGRKATGLDTLIMGIFQTLALLPGVSRSGTTITVGLHRRLDPDEAFTLSFWMFLPAALGSFVLEIRKVNEVTLTPLDVFVWIITFVVGVISLILLRKILIARGKFWIFGLYTLAVALLSATLFL